jgi:predicted tellurium resistance membrane protein TerC
MENLIALVFLSAMEIVLGIDNIVFIVILTGRLPKEKQAFARRAGLGLALVMRIILLFFISWVLGAKEALFSLSDLGVPESWFGEHHEIDEISIRDLIMIGGGLFLIAKSVFEIHEKMEGHGHQRAAQGHPSVGSVLIQIAILDLVFSLDSVITAAGMANELWVMITAVILAVIVMLIFSERISEVVNRYPSLKVLALSFLILIGVTLLAEGTGVELNKGYIYSAMAFALLVELVNIRVSHNAQRKRSEAVEEAGGVA